MVCTGCGVDNCSARELHEEVYSFMREYTQVECVEILRRHNIEIPNGFLDENFASSIVRALLKLESRVKESNKAAKKLVASRRA